MEPQDHGWGVGMEAGHRGGKGLGAQGEHGLREPGATWIPLEEDAGPAKGPPVRAVPLIQEAARVGAAGVGAGLGGSGRRQPRRRHLVPVACSLCSETCCPGRRC